MSKKEIGLILTALILGGVYVYKFTGTFNKPMIKIWVEARPGSNPNSRHHRKSDLAVEPSSVGPVSFTLDDRYELTSIKVVMDNEYQTNKYAHALWHLIAESNSVPTKGIIYGMKIKGMQPDIAKARPDSLQPNTTYRLLVDAGKFKGETTFKTREAAHPAE